MNFQDAIKRMKKIVPEYEVTCSEREAKFVKINDGTGFQYVYLPEVSEKMRQLHPEIPLVVYKAIYSHVIIIEMMYRKDKELYILKGDLTWINEGELYTDLILHEPNHSMRHILPGESGNLLENFMEQIKEMKEYRLIFATNDIEIN